jgi:hypothetical protein
MDVDLGLELEGSLSLQMNLMASRVMDEEIDPPRLNKRS